MKKNFFDKRLAFFCSLCLFLSSLEIAVPKPLPFLRLGLANLPLLLSLEKFRFRDFFALALMKIFLQGLLGGTFFSYIFIFSTAGTITSSITIYVIYKLLKKTNLISFFTLSLAGALASNCAQILCSRYILFGESVKYISPILLLFGTASGSLLGLFANRFVEKSVWYKSNCVKVVDNNGISLQTMLDTHKLITDRIFFGLSILSFLVLIFQKNVIIIWIFVVVFLIIDEIRLRGRVKILPSFILLLFMVFFELLTERGIVILTIGSFNITKDSLLLGLIKCGKLVGMLFISQCAFQRKIKIPGSFGNFIANIFYYYSLLTEKITVKKKYFNKRNFIETLDESLLKCECNEYSMG